MYKVLLVILFSGLISCNSDRDHSNQDPLTGNASWIGDGLQQPEFDSLFYLDDPSPIFRKEFTGGSEIISAKLYITAAGYYKASINGNRIGKNVLDPAWTNYQKRVYYSEYDISESINEGLNCLGVTLGNGFYNPLPMKMWGGRNIRTELPVGRPVFIARLVLKDNKGREIEILTDQTWKYTFGPQIRNSVYLGEVYDARKEINGWNKPGFDDSSWYGAVRSDGPGGDLQRSFFPPVQVTDTKIAVEISSPREGVFIADMGVNFTGDFNIRLKGNKGDTIVFRFGERIYDNGELNPMTTVCGQIKRKGVGGPGAPDIAWQTDSYIFGDNTDIWYNPEFTFHTYRYMEISGLKYKPEPEDIQGLFFHTNVDNRNKFECSSELLNSIQDASVRTFKANLISVQSDCPAREKFGYGGDLNATSETFIYNFDIQSFYKKTIYDWLDAIRDSVFVDTAPFVGIKYCGLSWESAFLITQYYLYLYYGDIDLVKELYYTNKEWMKKAALLHPEGIVDKGLSDHEALERVPVQLTGTSHYFQCASIMEEFADLMGDRDGQKEYKTLADELKLKIKRMFWDEPEFEEINKQTLYATLLFHNILPPEDINAAKDSLLTALKKGPSGHFTTGIFGTKFILEALSKTGCVDEVFNVVNSREYPGWGFMIEQGASTIWETWKESDNTFSNCHPMFGTVSEWFFRWLGGIRPDPENPGFKDFILSPSTPDNLNYVNSNYYSPFGEIISNWTREQEGNLIFNFTIPKGSGAQFILPQYDIEEISLISNNKTKVIAKNDIPESGILKLEEGIYKIILKYKS
ncbi:MAG: family 78 glycoside hydrolase catalytic domain [Bacteroidales bacterium]|nr:family 78 glycoside hydrolase catalytic domain [Bacteroidales bacterium]